MLALSTFLVAERLRESHREVPMGSRRTREDNDHPFMTGAQMVIDGGKTAHAG